MISNNDKSANNNFDNGDNDSCNKYFITNDNKQ